MALANKEIVVACEKDNARRELGRQIWQTHLRHQQRPLRQPPPHRQQYRNPDSIACRTLIILNKVRQKAYLSAI